MTGAELKALRYTLYLSLAQAARQVVVTPRSWARWEAGEAPIPEGTLKLFRLLNGLDKVPPREVGRNRRSSIGSPGAPPSP